MKQFWTKDEMDKLAEMAAQGKTNAQIAAALCRSVGSVAHKRARLFRDAEKYMTEGTVSRLFEGTAGAPEDFEEPDGEGTTEFERELKYVQELLDTATNAISHNAEILEHNMAALMERINDLSKDNTLLRDKAEAAEKQLEDQSAVICALRHDVNTLEDYLAHGPIWRLFHSYESFYRKEHEK